MLNSSLCGAGVATLALFSAPALAQQPRESQPSEAIVSPRVNHESGVVEQVFSARDGEYRFCGNIVRWRETAIFIGCSSQSLQRGDRVDFIVYRERSGVHRVLRFAASQEDSDSPTERAESEDSHATMTAGKADVQQVLIAESDGYRSVGYIVLWHDARVVVVDRAGASAHAAGDAVNFKVLRTEKNHELSFSLDEQG